LEAREWLESHGVTTSASLKRTLSDLFAVTGSQRPIVNSVPLKRAGFVR
jgi:hypothetical protein